MTIKLLIVSIFIFPSFSPAAEKTNPSEWVQSAAVALTNARSVIEQLPYRDTQHRNLDTYFSSLVDLNDRLETEKKFATKFSEFFEKSGAASVCYSILMSKEEWSNLMRNCQKNNFFLCSEKVRNYRDAVRAVRAKLTPSAQQQFNSTPHCTNPT